MKFRSKEANRETIQDAIANRISKGTIIEGEITSETDIRIDGKVNGILNCAAKVVVGKTGEMEGEIQCKDASLEGKVIGKLIVSGILFIKKTARIEGEVSYNKLIVEEGATILGSLMMSGNSTKSLVHDKESYKTESLGNSQQTA